MNEHEPVRFCRCGKPVHGKYRDRIKYINGQLNPTYGKPVWRRVHKGHATLKPPMPAWFMNWLKLLEEVDKLINQQSKETVTK